MLRIVQDFKNGWKFKKLKLVKRIQELLEISREATVELDEHLKCNQE